MTFANLQAAILTLVSLTDMMIVPYQVRTTAVFDKTSDTALEDVPGLTVDLVAGNNYRFTARLHCTAHGSGGVKATMSGTVGVGAIIFDGLTVFASSNYQIRAVALDAACVAVTSATPSPMVTIVGLVSTTVDGTLTVKFAQNASFATKSTVNVGSTLVVERLA